MFGGGARFLVLALALPGTGIDRPLIVIFTAGTVMLSLVGEGATMATVLRRLGVAGA